MQPEGEARARSGLAPDVDVAAEQPCVLERDRQAEAAARSRARAVRLVETVEEVRQVGRSDAAPAVGDLDEGADAVAADPHRDVAAAVLEGIPDQVGDDALEAP